MSQRWKKSITTIDELEGGRGRRRRCGGGIKFSLTGDFLYTCLNPISMGLNMDMLAWGGVLVSPLYNTMLPLQGMLPTSEEGSNREL
jgi:hypothetical protein